jgi:hypothetical protein
MPQAFVALGEVPGWWEQAAEYPMDYYSADGGSWNSTYHRRKPRVAGAAAGPSPAALAAAAAEAAGG